MSDATRAPRVRVFVYGSLMTGEPAHRRIRALPEARRLGNGWIVGRLYDLGEYPGALLAPRGADRVHGELWEFRWRRDVLRGLDRYEGFDPAAPASSLFVRRRVVVHGRTSMLRAWTYLLARPGDGRLIPSGDWRRRGAQRSGCASAPSRATRSATSSPSNA